MVFGRGIIPSLNTPFTDEGTIDESSLERLVDHVVEAGCCGMLALAVAGETGSLSIAEKHRMIDVIAGRNTGRISLIVGVSGNDWNESLELARHAASVSAAAVLWQPPPGLSEAELEAGLVTLGESGPDTVMLQDLDWQGPGLPVAAILRLFERVPGFKAIKIETIPAGPKYSAVLKATAGELHVSGGWAVGTMMEALARGVRAFMPTGMEPIYCRIHHLFEAGRREDARALFEAILPVLAFTNQHIDVSIRFFKALRVASGLFATPDCRPPVTPLDAVQRDECARLVGHARAVSETVPVSGPGLGSGRP